MLRQINLVHRQVVLANEPSIVAQPLAAAKGPQRLLTEEQIPASVSFMHERINEVAKSTHRMKTEVSNP